MVRYPDVQRKAQQELDAVVKGDRMPTMADYDRLPYIRAIVSECLRWNPIGPLGTSLCTDHRALPNQLRRHSAPIHGGRRLPRILPAQRHGVRRKHLVRLSPRCAAAILHTDGACPARYMTRDPNVYSDPLEFKPERFLEGEGRVPEQDPRYSVFGFGRRYVPSAPHFWKTFRSLTSPLFTRICPGMFLMFLVCTGAVWT